jgi:hypothetical protein
VAGPVGAPAPLHLFGGERSLTLFAFIIIIVNEEDVLNFLVTIGPGIPLSCHTFDLA